MQGETGDRNTGLVQFLLKKIAYDDNMMMQVSKVFRFSLSVRLYGSV